MAGAVENGSAKLQHAMRALGIHYICCFFTIIGRQGNRQQA
jgi:hypothetical protein